MNNFHPLDVVGRGSETQHQVGDNLNKLTWKDNSKQLRPFGFACQFSTLCDNFPACSDFKLTCCHFRGSLHFCLDAT